MSEKRYIGDSVYINTNGYHVILTTENGYPTDPSNTIFLEPHLIRRIQDYVEHINNRTGEQNGSTDERN